MIETNVFEGDPVVCVAAHYSIGCLLLDRALQAFFHARNF